MKGQFVGQWSAMHFRNDIKQKMRDAIYFQPSQGNLILIKNPSPSKFSQ